MFIAALSVKLKIKTYVQIHKMVMDYWDDYLSMDSKADSYPIYREFKRQRQMTLVTSSRRKENKTKHQILMHQSLQAPKLKQIYKERSYKVDPHCFKEREL